MGEKCAANYQCQDWSFMISLEGVQYRLYRAKAGRWNERNKGAKKKRSESPRTHTHTFMYNVTNAPPSLIVIIKTSMWLEACTHWNKCKCNNYTKPKTERARRVLKEEIETMERQLAHPRRSVKIPSFKEAEFVKKARPLSSEVNSGISSVKASLVLCVVQRDLQTGLFRSA